MQITTLKCLILRISILLYILLYLLQRFRYSSSILYAGALSLDYLTPLFPQFFLPMAALANVGKSVGLTTYISTQVNNSMI